MVCRFRLLPNLSNGLDNLGGIALCRDGRVEISVDG